MSAATQNELNRLYRERDKAREERDALAAHRYRISHYVFRYRYGHFDAEALADAMLALDATKPTISLARLKDERAQAIQKAVHQARMEWAKEDKAKLARLKAKWQAEALESLAADTHPHIRIWLKDEAKELRRQAEGGE